MAIDETKLLFSSNWDIDQVLASGTATVSFPASQPYGTRVEVYDYSALGMTTYPRVHMYWRKQGETKWNINGAANNFGGTTLLPIFALVTSTKLYAVITGSEAANTKEIRYVIYKNEATV